MTQAGILERFNQADSIRRSNRRLWLEAITGPDISNLDPGWV